MDCGGVRSAHDVLSAACRGTPDGAGRPTGDYYPVVWANSTLSRHTLDTLPFNVAVLDADGTILFTNRAWREFGDAGPMDEEDMAGVNCFGATDTEGDEHARAALEGLREVIDGNREVSTLAYPCHSPDERRWFLMRASPLSGSEEGRVVVAHIDITDRKLAELPAQRQHRDLERLTARLHGLVGDVVEAVLQARTRGEIEETVCETLRGRPLPRRLGRPRRSPDRGTRPGHGWWQYFPRR